MLLPIKYNVRNEIWSTSTRGNRPGNIAENRVSPLYFVAKVAKQLDVILANYVLALFSRKSM